MDLVAQLARAIEGLRAAQPRVTVGIDGPDAAGKTDLADRLASELGDVAVRASVDDFQHVREVRTRRGELSPEGCYHDTFDYDAMHRSVVEPFLAGAGQAVLVVDGVFLLRPELRDWWTLSVHLRVSAATTLERALARDVSLFGSREEVERRYTRRYLPAQAIYRAEADPEGRADILIDNTDPASPVVLRRPPNW